MPQLAPFLASRFSPLAHPPAALSYNSALSIWLSVDPLSDKYPSLSPYTYCANNPVRLVDPDGREVYITGDDANAALQQIQNQTNLKLAVGENGQLTYTGTARTKSDRMLARAITSKKLKVNIIANNSEGNFKSVDGNTYSYSFDKDGITAGGAYGGATYSNKKSESYQYVAPNLTSDMDLRVGDEKTGGYMFHELAEGFKSAQMALNRREGDNIGGRHYDSAHRYANRYSGGGWETTHHDRYSYGLVKYGTLYILQPTGYEKNYKTTYERTAY